MVVPAEPATGLVFDIGSPGSACADSTSDGAGSIAAESHSSAGLTWSIHDSRSTATGSFSGGPVTPQASGFVDLVGNPNALSLFLWDAGGTPRATQPIGDGSALALIAPRNEGGAAVLAQAVGPLGPNAPPPEVRATTFDAELSPLASLSFSSTGMVLAAAEDESGQILAISNIGQGTWLDLAHGTAGAPFSVGSATAAVARALRGGGVAVRLDGRWAGIARPGSGALSPPAPWMTEGADFFPLGQGGAYAVITANTIDIARGQTTCGSITLRTASSVSVGLDGTVIGSAGPNGCTKIFWPKLLQ